MATPLAVVLTITILIMAGWALYVASARRHIGRRLSEDTDSPVETQATGGMDLWLLRAGYRNPNAVSMFASATAAGALLGLLTYWALSRPLVTRWVESVGGDLAVGFGGLAETLSLVAPVLLCVFTAAGPYLWVRRSRRQRVETIERELPITLELLATLAEAGLGFDAGIATILDTESDASPMALELDVYQRDVLAGIPRTQALRNLELRCDIVPMSTFVSSLIQADTAGASLAETLRRQADDLRDRRKMQAVFLSQALPVKLVFPLLVCFLPGLFVATLGPTLNQLIKVVDSAIKHPR